MNNYIWILLALVAVPDHPFYSFFLFPAEKRPKFVDILEEASYASMDSGRYCEG